LQFSKQGGARAFRQRRTGGELLNGVSLPLISASTISASAWRIFFNNLAGGGDVSRVPI
jgi:hypothetical protein